MQLVKSYWELVFNDLGASLEHTIRVTKYKHCIRYNILYIIIDSYTDTHLGPYRLYMFIE